MTRRSLLSVMVLWPALAAGSAWAQVPALSDRIASPPVAVALQAVPAVPATPVTPATPGVQVVPFVPATPARTGPLVPLQVEISIARYQGDKRTSLLPYSVAVNANGERSSLQIGTEVPVAATTAPAGAQGTRSFNYRSVGTSINCGARDGGDGRFEVELQIDDNALYTSDTAQGAHVVAEMPVFRTFRSRNMLLLRDGQSRQYTAATDRVSGESVRIEVTLRVVK